MHNNDETVTITRKTMELLRHVASDARDLISCNCSYDSNTEQRCDGTCTHGMAIEALDLLHDQIDWKNANTK